MQTWIAVNFGDILVLSVLALVVAAVIAGMLRDKKKGKGCCSGCSGCKGCPGLGSCGGNCGGCKTE